MGKSLASYRTRKDNVDFTPLDDILGETVIVKGFTQHEGKFGEFVIMDITRASGEDAKVSTGAIVIVEALKEARQDGAFPLPACFIKVKKYYTIEETGDDE